MGDDERGFSTKTAGHRKRLWWKQRCTFVERWLNSTEKSASSKRALQRTRSNKTKINDNGAFSGWKVSAEPTAEMFLR